MTTSLTVKIDAELLELAEQEARARNTTLPEIITQQLEVMARNRQDTCAGKSPITDSLRGVISLPPGFDEKKVLAEELSRKYGIQE